MYEPAAVPGLMGMIRGGLLDLQHWAVTHVAAEAGPFKLTVLEP